MNNCELEQSHWNRSIRRYCGIKSQFLLWGNIHDFYAISTKAGPTTAPLEECLKRILTDEGYDLVCAYTPFAQIKCLAGHEHLQGPELKLPCADNALGLPDVVNFLRQLYSLTNLSAAFILEDASRLSEIANSDIRNEFFYGIFKLAVNSRASSKKGGVPLHHLILWLLDKENDLPPWYATGNPQIYSISIPRPNHAERCFIIESTAAAISGHAEMPEQERAKKN